VPTLKSVVENGTFADGEVGVPPLSPPHALATNADNTTHASNLISLVYCASKPGTLGTLGTFGTVAICFPYATDEQK
jgi:hypothetical protein